MPTRGDASYVPATKKYRVKESLEALCVWDRWFQESAKYSAVEELGGLGKAADAAYCEKTEKTIAQLEARLQQAEEQFCFVLFGLQLSVCLWWLQVPLRDLSDA